MSTNEETPFQTLIFNQNSFKILDQTLLPSKVEYVEVPDIDAAVKVIKEMKVRGAPLIAVVALQALHYWLQNTKSSLKNLTEALELIDSNVKKLISSRPTAVNLSNDLESLSKNLHELKESVSIEELCQKVQEFVKKNYVDYEKACAEISRHGADDILAKMDEKNKGLIHILTICNTGKLATPGDGTALGIVREIHRRNRLKKLYIPETRPYNQGSRLTATEAVFDHLPSILITDSMAASLMHAGKVDCVIVGADRVVQNGSTANKIGTYSLAVLAHYHNIPFYVACPESTIDRTKTVGSEITIEERNGDELKMINGQYIAPKDIECWNPAFDITYPHLIEKIFTENGEFKFPKDIRDWEQVNYERLEFLLKHKMKLFEKEENISITDVADGNLNLVYCVRGKEKAFCVKQALPYVKCVGPQWELSLKRALFEAEALKYEGKICPENVPKFFEFDKYLALLVMEFLEAPHIILRKGLIAQKIYKDIGATIGRFVAKTCFFASGLYLKANEMRERMTFWDENTLCALTEQVIFSDPYISTPLNHWNTPCLDKVVASIQSNYELMSEVLILRSKFIGFKQALIHADLHSGSIMVTEEGSYKVIDSEFAFYGPIGFDTGAFISNLLMSYFSQKGHKVNKEYEEWILGEIVHFYNAFEKEWLNLWNEPANRIGDEYPNQFVSKNEDFFKKVQKDYLKEIFRDTLGFAGTKIIRRIIGIAHVIDLDTIPDVETRGLCEKQSLEMAQHLIINRNKINSIEEVVELARKFNNLNL